MFWNDPTLYGATFPGKEFGTLPMPFAGASYYPRPFYGTLPQVDPRMFVQPWIQNPGMTPFIQPWMQSPVTPFIQPYLNPFVQTQAFTPFIPYNLNLPLHNVVRPFPY
jgi:hypothetical protein